MPKDQHQRRGIVVHDGGRFRVAQQSEIVLEVSRAATSRAASQVVLEIVVLSADRNRRDDRRGRQRSAAEIGVNDNARRVQHRPDARRAQCIDRAAHTRQHALEIGDRLLLAPFVVLLTKTREFPAHDRDHGSARQLDVAERQQHFFYRGDGPQAGRTHELTLIFGLAERTTRPMTAAQGVFSRFSSVKTASNRRSGTQSNNPPLVCASASKVFSASLTRSHSVNSFA